MAETPELCTSIQDHKTKQKCGQPLEIIGKAQALVCPVCDCLDHKGEPMLREREE